MESLKELYRIGKGPSSSHTMGPEHAARLFGAAYPQAVRFQAQLFGSLSKTGRGHLTDQAIADGLAPRPVSVLFLDMQKDSLPHPNTLTLTAYDDKAQSLGQWRVFSVGGGKIVIEGQPLITGEQVYALGNLKSIKTYCQKQNMRIWQYAMETEGATLNTYLHQMWAQMKRTVAAGLDTGGELPGGLHLQRKASLIFRQRHIDESPETREARIVSSYAFAISEENAGGGTVVTAPTCGACGVLPAVLLYMQEKKGFTDEQVVHALATGGMIGNIIKTNASISGAECGCQAEIGAACSMAAAALGELFGMDLDQIEYAAEVAMEHHLGLTCDPVCGLVQIPCIERNAVAAMRAIHALNLANFLTFTRKISFDTVVKTMLETGRDLFSKYRETGEGGLAKNYQDKG